MNESFQLGLPRRKLFDYAKEACRGPEKDFPIISILIILKLFRWIRVLYKNNPRSDFPVPVLDQCFGGPRK